MMLQCTPPSFIDRLLQRAASITCILKHRGVHNARQPRPAVARRNNAIRKAWTIKRRDPNYSRACVLSKNDWLPASFVDEYMELRALRMPRDEAKQIMMRKMAAERRNGFRPRAMYPDSA